MDRSTNSQNVEASKILALLSRILTHGLATEQQKAVLQSLDLGPIMYSQGDEQGCYNALIGVYKTHGDLAFAFDLANRITATQSFYRPVGAELDQLQYHLKKYDSDFKKAISTPYVFVLMPYQQPFFITYEQAIRPALNELGCEVALVKDIATVANLVDVIVSQIARSTFLVADTTGKNSNVFYELGYAHALGKKVILITQNISDIPFDIAGLNHIHYLPDSLNSLAHKLKAVARVLLNDQDL